MYFLNLRVKGLWKRLEQSLSCRPKTNTEFSKANQIRTAASFAEQHQISRCLRLHPHLVSLLPLGSLGAHVPFVSLEATQGAEEFARLLRKALYIDLHEGYRRTTQGWETVLAWRNVIFISCTA